MVNVIPNNSLQSDLYIIVGFKKWGIRVGEAGQVERKSLSWKETFRDFVQALAVA
jgi:hypothetical protein